MRSAVLLFVLLCSVPAFAASTNAPPATNVLSIASAAAPTNSPSGTTTESLVSEGWVAKSREAALSFELKPNEIRVGHLTLDGAAIEVAKVDNPLQLLNPFAPAKYGSPEDNI